METKWIYLTKYYINFLINKSELVNNKIMQYNYNYWKSALRG